MTWLIVLEKMIMLVLLMVVGFGAAKAGWVDGDFSQKASRLVMNVFVVGLNEGVFPSERTLTENAYLGLEEERRLCYVALTRAKEKLYLSCNGEYSYVIQSRKVPSRFFKEAGIDFDRGHEIRYGCPYVPQRAGTVLL
jgi:hypothetical protein